MFLSITKGISYDISKSNSDVNTIRHGLILLRQKSERAAIRKAVIQLKTSAHIDNDSFVDSYNAIVEAISNDKILDVVLDSLEKVRLLGNCQSQADRFQESIELLTLTVDELIDYGASFIKGKKAQRDFEELMQKVRLYNIEKPIVVLSANYGVPQNRERVLFIGCRNDQKTITDIPYTVENEDKVKVYEALWNLDMIGNGETITRYKTVKPLKKYKDLLIKRTLVGLPNEEGKLYSDWSREGRLAHRFIFDEAPFYVHSLEDLDHPERYLFLELFNHQTSAQSPEVKKRLKIIAQHGDYDAAKNDLIEAGLVSKKRNYTVLDPCGQSPTVCTMPDDFVHYAAYRPTTVREMARLQSFDDSFVFQGKRQTGGNNRQQEIPQYTLVGNAVPPLMARAIANTILENIR